MRSGANLERPSIGSLLLWHREIGSAFVDDNACCYHRPYCNGAEYGPIRRSAPSLHNRFQKCSVNRNSESGSVVTCRIVQNYFCAPRNISMPRTNLLTLALCLYFVSCSQPTQPATSEGNRWVLLVAPHLLPEDCKTQEPCTGTVYVRAPLSDWE